MEEESNSVGDVVKDDCSSLEQGQTMPFDGEPPDVGVSEICCIGAGWTGGPLSAVFASKNPKVNITVVDIAEEKIESWNSRKLPILEPGLNDLIKQVRGRNLWFSTDVNGAIRKADMLILTVPTPPKTRGHGAGLALDLKAVEVAVWSIIRAHEQSGGRDSQEENANEIHKELGIEQSIKSKIVVVKSTVPCGTAEKVHAMLTAAKTNMTFEVLSNPEFLSQGTAIPDLLHPTRILIGSAPTPCGHRAALALASLHSPWVPAHLIIHTSRSSAELAKLASNALLAQRIASANALAAACEAVPGASAGEVRRAVGVDPRIGPAFLGAGLGFGGSCLGKDLGALAGAAGRAGLEREARYWSAVEEVNAAQVPRLVHRMGRTRIGGLAGERVAVLGFAYKALTADVRASTAVPLVLELLREGALVRVFDPAVEAEKVMSTLSDVELLEPKDVSSAEAQRRLTAVGSLDQAVDGTSMVVLATAWDEFGTGPDGADWGRLYQSMEKPAWFFDGRGVVDVAVLERIGFRVVAVGEPSRWC